jgi:hypothetical protein
VQPLLPSDATAPTDAPVVSGTPGTNDWYTSDVSVSWNWIDAGNQAPVVSVGYSVVYAFGGFFSPVDNPSLFNVAKARARPGRRMWFVRS